MKPVQNILSSLKTSKLFRDSFWSIFGNGIGSFLLLLAGIAIARYLGRDVYGEYGVVKTNMFYLAGFSTFGLGLTSTRFIAKYLGRDDSNIRNIIDVATRVSLGFSTLLAFILVVFAKPLAIFLNEPGMVVPFRFLSFIIIIRSLGTTGNGILAGLGRFKNIGINSIISGTLMLASCVPLTYYYGLSGSFISLALSQVCNTALNYIIIIKQRRLYPKSQNSSIGRELVVFSFPVAMQEISYSVCNWAGILALTKLSTLGEVGIYSASAQWNAIILFIPGLLNNVVLSHLSKTESANRHQQKLRMLLMVFFVCTLIPFLIVYFFAPFIASFYGNEFGGMVSVIRLLTFATIPICCSDVFKSELLASGHPWMLFSVRCVKDVVFVLLVVLLLNSLSASNIGGADIYAYANLGISILFFFSLFVCYQLTKKQIKK